MTEAAMAMVAPHEQKNGFWEGGVFYEGNPSDSSSRSRSRSRRRSEPRYRSKSRSHSRDRRAPLPKGFSRSRSRDKAETSKPPSFAPPPLAVSAPPTGGLQAAMAR